jgi:uncharacterized membrane protein YdbT with pleckstrin-like domain
MGIPQRLLGEGERVVISAHPHWKRLITPVLSLMVLAPAGVYLGGVIPNGSAQRWIRYAIAAVVVLVLIRLTIWPFLSWLTTSYVVTNRRLITRAGVLARVGRDMPLARINDVSFTHTVVERLLRCGTLVVESAGERGQLVLSAVPRVEDVQREVYRLHEEDDEWRRTDPEDREPTE